METERFSDLATDIIQSSGKLAVLFKYDCVNTEHLLLAIIDQSLKKADKGSTVLKIFKNFNIDLFSLIEDIEATFDKTKTCFAGDKVPLTNRAARILKLSYLEAKIFRTFIINAEHILLAYLRVGSDFSEKQLKQKYKLSYDNVKDCLKRLA